MKPIDVKQNETVLIYFNYSKEKDWKLTFATPTKSYSDYTAQENINIFFEHIYGDLSFGQLNSLTRALKSKNFENPLLKELQDSLVQRLLSAKLLLKLDFNLESFVSSKISPHITDSSKLKQIYNLFQFTSNAIKQELSNAEYVISVTGSRGKSSSVKQIAEHFNRLGFNTLTKITGIDPFLQINRGRIPIKREEPRVTLYENQTVLNEPLSFLNSFDQPFVLILENQALTEYTMRVFNKQYFDVDILFITNIRQDHRDTLGKTRGEITRSFASSIPNNTQIINCEQNEKVANYLQNSTCNSSNFHQVTVPEKHKLKIGSETIYGAKKLFNVLDLPSLNSTQIQTFLENIHPIWKKLNDTLIFNAASVNDIESTEMLRRQLMKQTSYSKITPFIFLRHDRRSRTESFISYLNKLENKDLLGGPVHFSKDTPVYYNSFERKLESRTIYHNPKEETVENLLDTLTQYRYPVFIIGNTVHDFMHSLESHLLNNASLAEKGQK